MPVPETGTTDQGTQVRSRRSIISAVSFAILAPFVAFAYLTSAAAMDGYFCPPNSWKFGALGSFGSLQLGLLTIVLMVVILVIRTSTRITNRKLSRPLAFLRAIAKNDYYCATTLIYGLLTILLIWANYVNAYYCAGPSGIAVRTGLTGPPEALGWDHVRSAQAHCAITKSGLVGTLTLTLDNGAVVPLRLKTGSSPSVPGDYAPIRTAMSGQHYIFGLAPSVTQKACPPELYVAFTNWQK